MKIATFNINNVNQRLPNLLAWLKAAKPDIVCLQELKAEQGSFPVDAIEKAGFRAAWKGQKTWNGVAILSRRHEIHVTRDQLAGDPADKQSRYIEAAINGIIIGCIYLPNGNPHPGPKFDYKLAWFERLNKHARSLKKAKVPAVLAGDYNVVPTDFDIYDTRSYDDNALLQPKSRAAYQRLLKQGWTDALRHLYPNERFYTYWSHLRNRWPRDAGLRLDHFLLSPDLLPMLKGGGVDKAMHGEEHASDHVPENIQARYPLTLITGDRERNYHHSRFCDQDWALRVSPDPRLLMHPHAAAAQGIADGQWVQLEVAGGRVSAGCG